MLAPIIIFVYNRPDHTQRTIEALAKNRLASDSHIIIFSDAAKKETDVLKVEQVREYIDHIEVLNYFKSVHVIKGAVNKGLATSIIEGVTSIINEYGRVIVLEDDLITTVDFIEYMNNALDFYKEDKKIWSISAFNIPIEIPEDYKHNVYLSLRGSSWGWATWAEQWTTVDWEVKDYNKFRLNPYRRFRFNRGGRDLADMLDLQMNGSINSWAIRWCYSQSKQAKYTVYPILSRIQNIGFDGSGTHSKATDYINTMTNIDGKTCEFSKVEINKQILKSFQKYYISWVDHILIKPKRIIRMNMNKLLR